MPDHNMIADNTLEHIMPLQETIPPDTKAAAPKKPSWLVNFLFWGGNVSLLVSILFGLLPTVSRNAPSSPQGLEDILRLYFHATVILVPLGSISLGYSRLRYNARALLQLLYCVEMPLLLPATMGLFMPREITAAYGCLLVFFWLSALYVADQLFGWSRNNTWVNLIGAGLQTWCGIWLFLLMLYFLPALMFWPIAALAHPTLLLFGLVFLLTIGHYLLFIFLSPFFYTFYTYTNCVHIFTTFFARKSGTALAWYLGTLMCMSALFFTLSPGSYTEDLLAMEQGRWNKPESQEKAEEYREKLTDIYLAQYRYFWDFSEIDGFASAKSLPSGFLPFVYHGSADGMEQDQIRAERAYLNIFDMPILQGEAQRIARAAYAANAMPWRQSPEAGSDERQVRLTQQELSLHEDGEWADMELHEVYFNPEPRAQEISLHFSLPPGAVITGLWLSDDTTKKFSAAVSPRGAAQKTYNEIKRAGQDPALAEQLGPNLYRLKVFPIPANRGGAREVMHMWLRVRMLKQDDAVWRLPVMHEARNLTWDKKTTLYSQNGVVGPKIDAWLPESLPVTQKSKPVHAYTAVNGKTIAMLPRDHSLPQPECNLSVLVDTSGSMRERQAEILTAANEISRLCKGKGVTYALWDTDLAHFHEDLGDVDSLAKALRSQAFAGSLDARVLMAVTPPRRDAATAAVVLTDATLFRNKDEASDYAAVTVPTWFLLLGQKFPNNLSEPLLKRQYEVGGGVTFDVPSTLRAVTAYQITAAQADILDIDERYTWQIFNTPGQTTASGEPLATHKRIMHAIRQGQAKTTPGLDILQEMAVQAHIVSPYSSMLVLVAEWQQQLLERNKNAADRFERTHEQEPVSRPLPRPELGGISANLFTVKAVPEPEEWALMIAASCFLLVYLYKRRCSRRGATSAQDYAH